jgi:hypothetical protein
MDILGWGNTLSISGGDMERDIVVSLVAVEAGRSWGYGMARRALRGPKCVCLAAITPNISSIISLCAHSSSVMYLHPLEGWHFFFSLVGGNLGFFTVFGEVIDKVPTDGAFAFATTVVGDWGEELDTVVKVGGFSRRKQEYLAVAVVDGGQAFATLDVSHVVLTSPVFASQRDDSGVGGAISRR